MTIRLRGHHLLCLLGYRGMGYSDDFCTNMTIIYETLRTSPHTEVEIVIGPDDVCKAYPPDKAYHCEGTVYGLDAAVLAKLGLSANERDSWQSICSRVAATMVPEDISRLCTTCPWEKYGVCSEGVGLVVNGQPLPKVGS
ncbi:hypothetical protein BK133_06690 [Paenibacillus sp. FSL H8-0548]|uniref:DUF1284 domain-containing protein n=1 Tax=Paenibacillus sp. FSL H8-0548 TaxID=1920422 RepID=UPI00096DC27B|nr:DUF1284 domain-containing protein [Paenibacillus sp. FSL H8-0548]OMF37283.1 hypothetical protein BK133_06690 [Paenibacillus sp. FSL H8-0548]